MAESTDPWAKFDPRFRNDVDGLIYLGQLNETVSFCGHLFVLRTLKPREIAAIAKAIEPWQTTIDFTNVYNNAHVGMALVAIDGDSSFLPQVDPDLETFARIRLEYVTERWPQPLLNYLFSKYRGLEVEAATAIEALRDFYERGRTPSTPSVEDLTDKASLVEPTAGDIPTLV
jgi:hypothetical protein